MDIKRLLEEAAVLHAQGLAILDEHKDKDLPAEKQAEVDGLYDECQQKLDAVERLRRAERIDAYLNDPAGEAIEPADVPEGVKVMWEGRELTPREVREMQDLVHSKIFMPDGSSLYAEYKVALRDYLRHGPQMMATENIKALLAGDAQAGGYLVQDTFINQMIVMSRRVSAMRQISRVLPMVPSGSIIVPTEDSLFTDAEWTVEVGTGTLDTVKPLGQRRLQPKPLGKRVKVSNTFLRIPTFDVEAYIRDRMAYKFAIPEENAFINGIGDASQPRGLLNTPGLTYHTTAGSNAVTGDDVINWVYSLPAAYAAQARILCNRAFVRKIRLLKNVVDGQYIWQPGLQDGMPNRILDTPYVFSDLYDDGLDTSDVFEDDAVVAVIGDFSYYWIVDALGMTIQRLNELYAETNEVGFIGRKESDGQGVLAEAFLGLKIKA